nr:immunoglobulin light chain junction region [Homo sapiens]
RLTITVRRGTAA